MMHLLLPESSIGVTPNFNRKEREERKERILGFLKQSLSLRSSRSLRLKACYSLGG
jgi:hypothetical protein